MSLVRTGAIRGAAAGLARRSLSVSALDASRLVVEPSQHPGQKLPKEELSFGRQYTDHMLECDWTESEGWHAPVISAYHDFALSPAASSFHYGLQCFEGVSLAPPALPACRCRGLTVRATRRCCRHRHSLLPASFRPLPPPAPRR